MSKPKYDGKYVEILKWSKFNPRGDSKFPSWFRCENTLFFSPAFIDLDAQEICVALFVMCQVSAKNGEPTQIKTSHIARHARADHAKVESALDKLEQEGFLRLVDPKAVSAGPDDCLTQSDGPARPSGGARARSREVAQAHPNSPTTNERTDERNERTETNKIDEPEFARTRDTGQGMGTGPDPGMDFRTPERDPGDFDFNGPELIAQTIQTQFDARTVAPPEPPVPKPAIRPVIAPVKPVPARPQGDPGYAQPLFDPERYQHPPNVEPAPEILRKLREVGLGAPRPADLDPEPERLFGLVEWREGVAA